MSSVMSELYPSGPETAMLRALPPIELHLTLNVDVPVSTTIDAVTSVAGGEESYKNISQAHWEHFLVFLRAPRVYTSKL